MSHSNLMAWWHINKGQDEQSGKCWLACRMDVWCIYMQRGCGSHAWTASAQQVGGAQEVPHRRAVCLRVPQVHARAVLALVLACATCRHITPLIDCHGLHWNRRQAQGM